MKFFPTDCCALLHLTASNQDTLDELKNALWQLEEMSRSYDFSFAAKGVGARACFCIVCPGEEQLEQNLIALGFTKGMVFGRRKGYPRGVNTMWTLNW